MVSFSVTSCIHQNVWDEFFALHAFLSRTGFMVYFIYVVMDCFWSLEASFGYNINIDGISMLGLFTPSIFRNASNARGNLLVSSV